MVLSISAFAQGPQGPQGPRRGGDNGWRERVRAEKVAFLTEEIDLTESEAQVFWPIYNEIQKAQRDGFEAVKNAYEAAGDVHFENAYMRHDIGKRALAAKGE
jgi:hypothetical protein